MRAPLRDPNLDVASYVDAQLGFSTPSGLTTLVDGSDEYCIQPTASSHFAEIYETITKTRHETVGGRTPLTAGWSDARGTDEVREHYEMESEEAVLANFREFLVDHGARMHEALADLGRLEKSFNDTSSVALSLAVQIVSAKEQAKRARDMENLLNLYNDIVESVARGGNDQIQALLNLEKRLHEDMESGRSRRLGGGSDRLTELVLRATLLFELADATSTLMITPGPDLALLQNGGKEGTDDDDDGDSDDASGGGGEPKDGVVEVSFDGDETPLAETAVEYTLESTTYVALEKIALARRTLQARLIEMFVHAAGRGKPMVDEMATIAPLLLLEPRGKREMQRRLIACISATLCNEELVGDMKKWVNNVERAWEGQLRMIINVFILLKRDDALLADRMRIAAAICEELVEVLFCNPQHGVKAIVDAKLGDVDEDRLAACDDAETESASSVTPARRPSLSLTNKQSPASRRVAARKSYLNALALTHNAMRELARGLHRRTVDEATRLLTPQQERRKREGGGGGTSAAALSQVDSRDAEGDASAATKSSTSSSSLASSVAVAAREKRQRHASPLIVPRIFELQLEHVFTRYRARYLDIEKAHLRDACNAFYGKLKVEADVRSAAADLAAGALAAGAPGSSRKQRRERRTSVHMVDMGGRSSHVQRPSSSSVSSPSTRQAAASIATDSSSAEMNASGEVVPVLLPISVTGDIFHSFALVDAKKLHSLIEISILAQRRCREVMSKGLSRYAESQLDPEALKTRIEAHGTLFDFFVHSVCDNAISVLDIAVKAVRKELGKVQDADRKSAASSSMRSSQGSSNAHAANAAMLPLAVRTFFVCVRAATMMVDALQEHLLKGIERAIMKQKTVESELEVGGNAAQTLFSSTQQSSGSGSGGTVGSSSSSSRSRVDSIVEEEIVTTNALKTRSDTKGACVQVLHSKQSYMAVLVQQGLSAVVGVAHSLFRRLLASQSANAYQQETFDQERHEQRYGRIFKGCACIVSQFHMCASFALPDIANRSPLERVFGCRLYATVIGHFKQFKTSQEGALAMLGDIGKIEIETRRLEAEEVDSGFELLRKLVTLLHRPEETLVEAVQVGALAVCEPSLLAAYLCLRTDTERLMVQRAISEVMQRNDM